MCQLRREPFLLSRPSQHRQQTAKQMLRINLHPLPSPSLSPRDAPLHSNWQTSLRTRRVTAHLPVELLQRATHSQLSCPPGGSRGSSEASSKKRQPRQQVAWSADYTKRSDCRAAWPCSAASCLVLSVSSAARCAFVITQARGLHKRSPKACRLHKVSSD